MRIGFFGGSFDPPHICHAMVCLYVLEMTDVEKILWVPCVDHPFAKTAASFDHRLAMSRLAASALTPRVEVSDIESTLPLPSYTINTVETLYCRIPDARISVILGSDITDELDRWTRIEDLRRLANFIVVPRGGFPAPMGDLGIALPRLSSTAIREALQEGRSVETVVTRDVLDYINQHRLYRKE